MKKAFNVPHQEGMCSSVIKELNLHEERNFVQNETRDFRFSNKIEAKLLSQILNDSLTRKHELLDEKIKAELNDYPILHQQVEGVRCMQGPGIEQILANGGGLNACEDDLYFDQVLRNHAKIKSKEAADELYAWANHATFAKNETLSSVLKRSIHVITDCQGVSENLNEEILRRKAARGIHTGSLLQRREKSQNSQMYEYLRRGIEETLILSSSLEDKGASCGGKVYRSEIKDIYLLDKSQQSQSIYIKGINNFTEENIASYTDHAVEQVRKYAKNRKDQDCGIILKKSRDLGLGDYRTRRNFGIRKTGLILLAESNRVLYMPADTEKLQLNNR